MFKIGDRVRYIEHGCLTDDTVYTVRDIHYSTIDLTPTGVRLDGWFGAGDWWAFDSFELVEQMNNKVPHKHSELIKAWADGAEIEVLAGLRGWCAASQPLWGCQNEYRIKPEPKPDIVCKEWVRYSEDLGALLGASSKISTGVNFTFDGETRKLKSVEILVQENSK